VRTPKAATPAPRQLGVVACSLLAAAAAAQSVVQGEVADVLGHGVPAASVRALDAAGAELRRSGADGDGMFVLAVPDGATQIEVAATGRLTLRRLLPDGAERRALRLELEDTVELRGRVRSPDGAPLAGVDVIAYRGQDRVPAWSADAVSDARGEFAFAPAPVGALWLCAWAPGRDLVAIARTPADAGPVELVLPACSGAPQAVQVDGVPAGRVATLVLGHFLPRPLRTLTSDANGRVLLPRLPHVERLGVACPGCRAIPEQLQAYRGPLLRFRLEELPARLVDPHTTARCRVLGPDGAPIAGATVLCGHGEDGPFARAASDRDGLASVTLPVLANALCRWALTDCLWQLDGAQPNGPPLAAGGIHAGIDPDAVRELRAHAAGGIRVHAALPGGVPMRFAPVEALRQSPEALRIAQPFTLSLRSATDRDGNVALLGLEAGEYQLRLRGTTHAASATVAVVAGKVAEVAQLRFDELGECSGLMTDGAGQPLPGVEVSAWLTHDSVQQAGLMPGEGGASCITDRNGCYRLRGLVPGRWQVSGRTVDVEAGRPATLDVSKR
jgi:hypothetical protein